MNFEDFRRKMNDGNEGNLIEHTTYRKGNVITLNTAEVDRARECVKNGIMHPGSGPSILKEVEDRFRKGQTAVVIKTMPSRSAVFFVFEDGFESGQNQKWLKKVKKTK